jgi:hypothetical protein
MIVWFGNAIYDLRYAEKVWLDGNFYLRIRFYSGKEEIIDLRSYRCRPDSVMAAIYNHKNEEDYAVRYLPGVQKE